MKTVKQKSPYPFLVSGGVWLIMGLITPIYKLPMIILTLALSVGAYFASKALIFKDSVIEVEEKADTGDASIDSMIDEGRKSISRLHESNEEIIDEHITSCLDRMEKAGAAIFDKIEKDPDKAPSIRRFMNYYLPTTEKLLKSYSEMNALSSEGENVSQMKSSISNSMEMIATAFEKQLDALYKDNAIDVETDIKVLQTLIAADGNSADEGVTLKL